MSNVCPAGGSLFLMFWLIGDSFGPYYNNIRVPYYQPSYIIPMPERGPNVVPPPPPHIVHSKSNQDKLQGGKQWQRDDNYGIKDRDFWNWWHRSGKSDQEATPQDYQDWKDKGRPRGPDYKKPWKK